jgi:hypothetical protein
MNTDLVQANTTLATVPVEETPDLTPTQIGAPEITLMAI